MSIRLRRGRIVVTAAALILATGSPALGQAGTAGPHGLRHGVSASLLGSLDDPGAFPEGRTPSLRAAVEFQPGRRVGLHFGVLRLAPPAVGLWSGVGGVRATILSGRFRLALFGEGGGGLFDAAVDSGTVRFRNPDGSIEERPFLRPVHGIAFGGGAGAVGEVVLFSGLSLSLQGGYWHFAGEDVTIRGPFAGVGFHIRRDDSAWYWRTSGRDTVGGGVAVLASQNGEGAWEVGYGDLRLVAHDPSGVDSVWVNGRSVALGVPPGSGWTGAGPGRLAVARRLDLGLAQGVNPISVRVRDGAGNVRDHVLPVMGPPPDESAPIVAVTEPAPGASLPSDWVDVRGYVVDPSALDSVHINGVGATLTPAPLAALRGAGLSPAPHDIGWSFHARVPALAGVSPLEVTAVDRAGNAGNASVLVSRPDQTRPAFASVDPVSGSRVSNRFASLGGVVVDDGIVASITVNDLPARVERVRTGERGIEAVASGAAGASFRFEATVGLVPGVNTIRLTAEDASGNRRETVHELVLVEGGAVPAAVAEAAPEIRILEPAGWTGSGTRGIQAQARRSFPIRGTITDRLGRGIEEITIDGKRASVTRRSPSEVEFHGLVSVEEGMESVEIFARTSDRREISRVFPLQPLPPARGGPGDETGFAGDRYAVVIGISEYRDVNIRDLAYADDDARAFHAFITSPAAGPVAIRPGNSRLLLNENATTQNIREALYDFLEDADEDDIVYIYIAAHGVENSRRRGNYYVLTHDTDLDRLASTAVDMEDINEVVRELPVRHTLLFTDACHSGAVSAAGTRAGLDDAHLNEINRRFLYDLESVRSGLGIFTASESGEPSREGAEYGGGHGVFTYFLLEGLRGAADSDGDQIVRYGELVNYTTREVQRATHDAQNPTLAQHSHDRFMPLAVVGGGR